MNECEENVISSLRELKFNAYNDNGVYLLHTQNLEKLLSASALSNSNSLFIVDPKKSSVEQKKKRWKGKIEFSKIVSCKSRGI